MNSRRSLDDLAPQLSKALEEEDLKTLAQVAHELFLMTMEKVQREMGNTEGVLPVLITKRGYFILEGQPENTKRLVEEAGVAYALTFEGRLRSTDTGEVTDEDVVLTLGAKGLEDQTYRITQTFKRSGTKIEWCDSDEGFESRLEKATMISDMSLDRRIDGL